MCKPCLKLTQYICDLCESEKGICKLFNNAHLLDVHLGVVPTNGKDAMNVIMPIMKIDLFMVGYFNNAHLLDVHVKNVVIKIKYNRI